MEIWKPFSLPSELWQFIVLLDVFEFLLRGIASSSSRFSSEQFCPQLRGTLDQRMWVPCEIHSVT